MATGTRYNVMLGTVEDFEFEPDVLQLPEPTLQDKLAALDIELDKYLDAKAAELTFSGGRINLAVRAGYPNPWQQLAIAFGTWMDQCNQIAWQLAQDTIAGNREIPTVEEAIAAFPVFVAPSEEVS